MTGSPAAIVWIDGQVHPRERRLREGGGRHRRDRLRLHRPAAAGSGLLGQLSVPRREDAVVQGQPAGQALLLLRMRGEWGRIPLRGGEGGVGFRLGGGVARREDGGRVEEGERGPEGGGAEAAEGEAVGVAGADGEVLRAVPVGVAEGGAGAEVSGGPGAGGGGAAAVRRGDGAEPVGPGAYREPKGGVQGRGAARGRAGADGTAGWALRQVPQPDHLPDS